MFDLGYWWLIFPALILLSGGCLVGIWVGFHGGYQVGYKTALDKHNVIEVQVDTDDDGYDPPRFGWKVQ